MAASYVIGIDGGTESVRAGVFDTAGQPVGVAQSAYDTAFPGPAWAEQDPEAWWRALGEAVRGALRQAGIDGRQVAGLALDTTCCTVVLLDESGQPLRPSIIWMDVRAAEEAQAVAETGATALKVNGGGYDPVSAEWMLPKALWLKRHEPDNFARAATVCEYQDFLNYRLTGRLCASLTSAAIRWHYDNRRSGGFPTELLDQLGLAELSAKWPQTVLPLGAEVGGLTKEAGEHLGLPAGTAVLQGGADAFVATAGLGVTGPGQMAFITGSSHLLLGHSAAAFHGKGLWGTYADAVIPGLHTIEGGQTSTGSVINWYRHLLGRESYNALTEAARQLPPGSEGLLVLDHFQGNRTPYTDPQSRGVIAGLTLKHGPGHIFRALMEGTAFGTELILERMRTNGLAAESAVVAGGATHSELWLQIHADVSGLPLSLTQVSDAPALGSAILAATGTGLYPDIPSAAAAMVTITRTVQPDERAHAAYRPIFQVYRDLYPEISNILHRRAALTGEG